MSTIFPGSASVGQVYNGYTFDGTAWNINGIDLTENYLEESSASATYQTKLTAGSGLSLNGSTLGVNPGAMLNTIVDGTSGNSYGLVGTSTYLDVKDTNGYNKEIELDIAAVESQLVTDGFLKNSSASGTYLTQTSASTNYATKTEVNNVSNQSGLVLITTSTQTASATNFLDGIFSSSYRNYKIIGDFTGTGGGGAPVAAFFKFKVGGSYSSAHYGSNVYGSYNDSVVRSINTSNAAVFHFSYTNTLVTHFEMDVHSPFINNAYKSITGQYNSVGLGIQGSFGGHAGTTSSYTGFELSLGTGNISGNYVVYGYNDGY